jgi:addiction module HigA family antidote
MNDRIKNEYIPDDVTPPGETLQEILDTLNMKKSELADRTGRTQKFIIDIIKHGAAITPTTALELEKVIGTPAGFWLNRERRYRESLARKEERRRLANEAYWLKSLPVSEMTKLGWINKRRERVDQVTEMLQFFGVASSKQWENLWFSSTAAFRKSRAFSNKPGACSAWLRKGELQAQNISCSSFSKERFNTALKEIRSLTRRKPEHFESRTVEMCSDCGVAVVFTPSIRGAPVYGATRWLTPVKAMVQLSLRGKFEDMLWFTFFHEAGHILLHGKKEVFIEDSESQTEKEVEANRFAAHFLIPNRDWTSFVSANQYQNETSLKAFAKKQGISPAIVVGRLQHEGLIPHSHHNGLRRRFKIVGR